MSAEPYIGEVQVFAGPFAPRGWMTCDGTMLDIRAYTALYAVIGNRFGGDGQTTFALPDLRGRVALGAGSGPNLTPRAIGTVVGAGAEAVTLTESNLPVHTHASALEVVPKVQATTTQGSVSAPGSGALLASGYDIQMAVPVNGYTSATTAPVALGGTSSGISGNTASTGGAGPHENRMPYLAVNYIIAVQGYFPQRP